jgi:hypothetical protein
VGEGWASKQADAARPTQHIGYPFRDGLQYVVLGGQLRGVQTSMPHAKSTQEGKGKI